MSKSDSKCAFDSAYDTSGTRVTLFYERMDSLQFNPQTSSTYNVIDSFCLDPKIQFWNVGRQNKNTATLYYRYLTPFGTFDTKELSGSTTKIVIPFCENSIGVNFCNYASYKKTITLYSNVGVVE